MWYGKAWQIYFYLISSCQEDVKWKKNNKKNGTAYPMLPYYFLSEMTLYDKSINLLCNPISIWTWERQHVCELHGYYQIE